MSAVSNGGRNSAVRCIQQLTFFRPRRVVSRCRVVAIVEHPQAACTWGHCKRDTFNHIRARVRLECGAELRRRPHFVSCENQSVKVVGRSVFVLSSSLSCTNTTENTTGILIPNNRVNVISQGCGKSSCLDTLNKECGVIRRRLRFGRSVRCGRMPTQSTTFSQRRRSNTRIGYD